MTIQRPDIPIQCLRNWRNGALLQVEDGVILAAAQEEALTLVTYDQRTIAPLVLQWAMEGRNHAGVLFVNKQTIAQADVGGQVRALIALWDATHSQNWTNVITYLKSDG